MIYKNWKSDLNKRFWIKQTFNTEGFEKDLYNSVLETMRYISSYIYLDSNLKKDLHEIRNWYNCLKL